jgi:hypothetical protein
MADDQASQSRVSQQERAGFHTYEGEGCFQSFPNHVLHSQWTEERRGNPTERCDLPLMAAQARFNQVCGVCIRLNK